MNNTEKIKISETVCTVIMFLVTLSMVVILKTWGDSLYKAKIEAGFYIVETKVEAEIVNMQPISNPRYVEVVYDNKIYQLLDKELLGLQIGDKIEAYYIEDDNVSDIRLHSVKRDYKEEPFIETMKSSVISFISWIVFIIGSVFITIYNIVQDLVYKRKSKNNKVNVV